MRYYIKIYDILYVKYLMYKYRYDTTAAVGLVAPPNLINLCPRAGWHPNSPKSSPLGRMASRIS